MQPQTEKIKNQQETTINQPESHGETTKDNDNKQQIQTQDKRLLSPKAGYVQHTNPHYGLFVS